MSITTLILCDEHADLLREIARREGDCSYYHLQTATGRCHSYVMRAMADLRERCFVDTRRAGSQRLMLHQITESGQRALAAHDKRRAPPVGEVAGPNYRSLFDLPVYQPQAIRAYYRNDGNAHINSHGVRC